MKTPSFIYVKKKKSPVIAIVVAVCAVAAAAAAAFVVYKKFGEQIKAELEVIKAKLNALTDKTKVLGVVDIDGDGEADALILDTTGNGEVDTIILNDVCEVCEACEDEE